MDRPRFIICEKCAGTGFADKVDRGFFAPGTCHPCLGSGWVDPETGTRFNKINVEENRT